MVNLAARDIPKNKDQDIRTPLKNVKKANLPLKIRKND
jgi:hypothetical protein